MKEAIKSNYQQSSIKESINERTIVENNENVEFTIYQIITLNFHETDRQKDRLIDETKRGRGD